LILIGTIIAIYMVGIGLISKDSMNPTDTDILLNTPVFAQPEVKQAPEAHSHHSILVDNLKLVPLIELFKLFLSTEEEGAEKPRSRNGRMNMPRHHKHHASLTPQKFQEILIHHKLHGDHIADAVLKKSHMTEEDIAVAFTASYGFPYIPLNNYEINFEAAKLISHEVADRHILVPIDQMHNTLLVAMANPLDTRAIREVEHLTERFVQVFVSSVSDIKKTIDRCYRYHQEATGEVDGIS
jgi:hypothetical protein